MIHLNIDGNKKKSNPSEDLTVILLRGNGSPRSFRLSLPALHRSLTAIGFLFALAILTSLVLLGFSLVRAGSSVLPVSAPVAVSPMPSPAPATGSESPPAGTGIWQQLKGSVDHKPAAGDDSELQKEVSGLRADIAKLNAQIDGRKDLTPTASPLLQFFGPRSQLVPESQSVMRIRNAKVTKDQASKQILLDFELHNVDPQQRQERGYIVALAKSPDLMVSYPNGVFAPGQNIVMDFTRGETFAVSRFRQARATFPLVNLDSRRLNFQILLFGTDGKVLGNLAVEGQ